jgi:DNA polymerase-1
MYGMRAKKGGETLNVSPEEAQVMINVIREEFPKITKMLDEKVLEAFLTGAVIFNKKSNNRRIFQPVREVLEKVKTEGHPARVIINYVKQNISFEDQLTVDGAARNCSIQGSQADMLKEAMVNVHKYIIANNIKAKILMSIHDELVIQHNHKGFGTIIGKIMTDTANSYLRMYSDTIKMSVSVHTGTSWTK